MTNEGNKTHTRILIVEDDDEARQLLESLLQQWGFSTLSAVDGSGCLKVIDNFQPHFVIIDAGLPDMDGYQLAALLRERHGEHLRLIALTGNDHEEALSGAYVAGFDLYLTKPVDVTRLKSALQGRGF